MSCLKCGKETAGNQVFCDNCLCVMELHPIKPDAKVSLPHREEAVIPRKSTRKRAQSPEEQLTSLHRLVRRLIVALALVSLLFCLCAAALAYTYLSSKDLPVVGRNYTIDTTQQP